MQLHCREISFRRSGFYDGIIKTNHPIIALSKALMSLRFQKRVSILPGVRLNFSASGMSATIGVPGASINLGGTRCPPLNLGIPGSGIGASIPLGTRDPHPSPRDPRSLPVQEFPPRLQPHLNAQNIQSAAVEVLTTPSLAELRRLILTARREREAAERGLRESVFALEQAERAAKSSREERERNERHVSRLEASWFRAFRKGTIASARQAVVQALAREEEATQRASGFAQKQAEAADYLKGIFLEAEFALGGPAEAVWNTVNDAFKRLTTSHKIWDVTTARDKLKGQERSSATRVIDRQETKLSLTTLPVIHAQYKALCWHNKNGHDFYLYPGFIIVYSSDDRFAMIDLSDVELKFRGVPFQETDPPPADAKRVGIAYTYSNKDGSPDRRYAHNPEIPILLYAEIHFVNQSGFS